MAGKQTKKKKTTGGTVKTPANTLSFLADEDPDILFEANELKKLRKHKSVRPATRDIVYEALHNARLRLEAEIKQRQAN